MVEPPVAPCPSRPLSDLAREDLGAFGAHVFDLWPAAHHALWVDLLSNPAHDRLCIIAPPGHAKSTWVSLAYPAWLIGRDPGVNILLVSLTAAMARLFSITVRDTIALNPAYHEVFPDVAPDRRRGWARDTWFVQRDGRANKDATFAACGVHGPVIGRRADVIIVDDPCDGDSTATLRQRKSLWDWFRLTLLTRLRPAGRVVVVMTRWTPDDLAGSLLETEGFVICRVRAMSEGSEVCAEVVGDEERGE